MTCYPFPCAEWTDWSPIDCSTNCGYGIRTQTRNCSDETGQVVTPKYCRGKPEDTTQSSGQCYRDTCPGWTDWETTNCTAICDGGIFDRSRDCKNDIGVVVSDPLDYPDLCPGGVNQEIGVPCNTHTCPPPIQCPSDYPYAVDDGWSCCRYGQASDSCGGGDLLLSDPVTCCRTGAVTNCTNNGGKCHTLANAHEYCQAHPAETKLWQKWIFKYINSGQFDYFSAQSECANNHGGILVTLNEPGQRAAIEAFATSESLPDGPYWTTLREQAHENTRNCINGACDGFLRWEGANDEALVYDAAEYPSGINYDKTEVDRSQCGMIDINTGVITTIRDEYCLTNGNLLCQINCHEGLCPADKPFPVNNGAHCCESFKRTATGGVCDGGDLLSTDPVTCCAGQVVACPTSGYPCFKHPTADRFCPANQDLTRLGGDNGYFFDILDIEKRYLDSTLVCNSKESGHLNVATSAEAKEAVIMLRDAQDVPTSHSFFIGLTHPDLHVQFSCTNANCDNKDLSWGGYDAFTYDNTAVNSVSFQSGWNDACAQWGIPIYYADYAMTPIDNVDCLEQSRYTMCQASCAIEDSTRCPATHPFPVDNGSHCCRTFQRINSGSCDGETLRSDDPLACCPTDASVPCPSGSCVPHQRAKNFCPGNPSLVRTTDPRYAYTGYAGNSVVYTVYDALEYCATDHNGRLPVVRTFEALVALFQEKVYENEKNIWLGGGKFESGPRSACTGFDCDDKGFEWDDGFPRTPLSYGELDSFLDSADLGYIFGHQLLIDPNYGSGNSVLLDKTTNNRAVCQVDCAGKLLLSSHTECPRIS